MSMSLVVRYPDKVENEIADEQLRQIRKFGLQNHHPFVYLAILTEEVGEAAQAAVDTFFPKTPDAREQELKHLREELIQVAAVAKSFVECLDRAEWRENV